MGVVRAVGSRAGLLTKFRSYNMAAAVGRRLAEA